MSWQKIFAVGGDGGSISIMGRTDQGGHWSFLMVCDERTMMTLTDEFRVEDLYSRNYSKTWEGILDKLDDYPWTRLYPLGPFHDQFKERIWEMVIAREDHDRCLDRWAEHCDKLTGFGFG